MYKNNKFKILGTTWAEEFELLDGSNFISYIQDCFEYIVKKHKTLNDKPPVQIYVKIIQNRVTFKIKSWYYLELLTPKTMKLLRSTEEKITRVKNDVNVSYLENTEVVLIHCNIINNQYQSDS